jgi:UDP-N-acetylmuramyl tripeptide synthase
MLVEILEQHGVSVFSNPSGGNLPQGIASAMLAKASLSGRLREQIAVLEVDEAFGPALSKKLKPSSVLLLNVQVDQLNRFYEPDRVVAMLDTIATAATSSVIVNADDDSLRPLGARLAARSGVRVEYFGVATAVRDSAPHGLANARVFTDAKNDAIAAPSVVVSELSGSAATVTHDGISIPVRLPARGLHYAVDVAGAAATAATLLGKRFDPSLVTVAMDALDTVYGRGETLEVRGEPVEIIMVKNLPSMQMNLDYLGEAPEQLFLTIDEGTPDPSWLYDTDFSGISHVDVISGSKAWQIATRLGYAEIPFGDVIPDMKQAVTRFMALPRPSTGNKVMIVNYEQMMLIRKHFGFLELEGTR